MQKTRELTSVGSEMTWEFLLNDIFQNSSLVLPLKKKDISEHDSLIQHLFYAHKIRDPLRQKANEKSTNSMPMGKKKTHRKRQYYRC